MTPRELRTNRFSKSVRELQQQRPEGASSATASPVIALRDYQHEIFWGTEAKCLLLHWSRQIGKSYTLAAWAVSRLLNFPGRLVTVLSNSRENGSEFVVKAVEICRQLGVVTETENVSRDLRFESTRLEVRLTVGGLVSRLKVLAANPRTARGFSGDLILDEFAFHEDARAIWEAAEPIISSHQDFQCRIASTGNGRQNMFYQLIEEGRITCSRQPRSVVWKAGEVKIYSAINGRELTPDEARGEASDQRAYDQNYECSFEDEHMPLLTHELIAAAERATGWSADRQQWSLPTLQRFAGARGPLEAGWDIGRFRDLSVICVFERLPETRQQLGELIMEDLRTPQQLEQARVLLRQRKLRRLEIDRTGLGLGLCEKLEEEFSSVVIGGVDFASSEPVTARLQSDGRAGVKARVTEIMATDLLGLFEARAVEIFADQALREDLRKPERVTSPGGRVSIAASRDRRGHADRFWAMALAIRAGLQDHTPGSFHRFHSSGPRSRRTRADQRQC